VKILQVASSLPGSGGIEKSVLHLATGLRTRGHEVEITAIPDSWVWKQAQEKGFVTLPVTVRNQHDFMALQAYREIFRRGSYDIVNVHFSPDYLVPALAAKRAGQRGMVMTRYIVKPWRGVRRWLYGETLYERILAVSEAVRGALLTGGITPERVVTVHGGVEVPAETVAPAPLREELNLPPDTVLIGIVSRIAPEKGHRFLLEAMHDVDSRAVCLVVGEGPDETGLREFARANALESRVRFLGWRLDSAAIMTALDVVVQPSLWEEACSLAIMEAMSLGKALVVTRVGGNPELVLNEQSGLVVPKEDAAALAAALNTLVRSPEMRERMGTAARGRQRAGFSVETMTAGTERVYEELRNSR
jgi:glycosyltransferase involved in cell wall biosynthesis